MVLQQEGPAAVLFYALRDIQRGEALSISVRASSSALTILRAHILFPCCFCSPLPLLSDVSVHHWTGKHA